MKAFSKSVLLVVALTGLSASSGAQPGQMGEVLTEPKTGFQFWVPAGWAYGTYSDLPFAHLAVKAPDETSGTNCIVGAEDIAITKGATQAQLNGSLKVPVGRDFWKSQAFKVFDNVQFESDGTRLHPSGIMIQEAVGGGDIMVGGKKLSRKMVSVLWITPGVTYTLICSAYTNRFDEYRPSLANIVESFRTKDTAGTIGAALNPPPGQTATPVVSMHGSAGFGANQSDMGRAAVATPFKFVKGGVGK